MPTSPFANIWRIYFVAAHKLILNISEPPRTAVGLCSSEFFARKTRRWTTYTDVRCSTGYFQKQCSHAVAIFVKAKYYFWISSTYQNVQGWTGNKTRAMFLLCKNSPSANVHGCTFADIDNYRILKKKLLFSISVGFINGGTNSLNVSHI